MGILLGVVPLLKMNVGVYVLAGLTLVLSLHLKGKAW
jgi:hypothetical protein